MSCVRVSPSSGVRFLHNENRMKVGVARAKSSMWIVGSQDTLRRSTLWNSLIDTAIEKSCNSQVGSLMRDKIIEKGRQDAVFRKLCSQNSCQGKQLNFY